MMRKALLLPALFLIVVMRIETVPGERKTVRKLAGPFQHTFETPLARLPIFTEAVLGNDSSVRSGRVFVETVVFEPTRLAELLAAHGLSASAFGGSTITASGLPECRALLAAALGDCIDFFFVPDPKQFLLYVDHDQYVTLFTHRRGRLSQMVEALIGAGIKEVAEFRRSF